MILNKATLETMLYVDYMTFAEIAEAFNVSRQYIHTISKQLGIKPLSGRPRLGRDNLTVTRKDNLTELVKSSKSLAAVARQVNLPYKCVSNWMKFFDIKYTW